MASNPVTPKDPGATTTTNLEPAPKVPSGELLAGTDSFFDGKSHVGVAIEVAASGKVSHLVVSDAAAITSGAPIFISAPVRLEAKNLANYLKKKGIPIPEALDGLLSNLNIACEAFYVSYATKKLSAAEATKYITDMKLDANSTPKAADVKEGYEADDSVFLMMFQITVDGGLIKALTHDEDLSSLFDINNVSLRALRCPASKRDALVKYVQSLATP